MIAKS
jgi:hypothetical protein